MKFNNVGELVSFVASRPKMQEWQRELFSQYAEEIQVHSKGELFYKIDRLFPNEHPLSKEHRVLSFESITKGSFWKGVDNIVRIFQNSSYSAEASESTIDFISKNNFEKQNLFSYFLEKWCMGAIADDPNGRIVVYPMEFMAEGKTFPQLAFIPSKLVQYVDNETCVFLSEEESVVRYENKEGRVKKVVYDQRIDDLNLIDIAEKNTFVKKTEVNFVKRVYHVFTDEAFYRVAETEISDEFDFEIYPFKVKGFMPCFSAGGMEVKRGIYQSFFSVFCPFGNLALLQHSQHTAVNFMFSFPRMSEIETPCDAFGCDGKGYVTVPYSDANPDGKQVCIKCNGSGYATNQSVYKIYKRKFNPQDMEAGTGAALNVDDVKFYTPDTTILDYSKKEWRDYLDFAEQTLYISQKIMTGNVESAKSKEFDRDDRYNFLSKIAKVFYDRLRLVVQAFENYLNVRPIDVSINIPFSFAIENEMDTFTALQTILVSDAPVMVKANKIETFINKFVSQNSPVKKFFYILRKVDLLLFYSDAQIASQKAGGIVSAEQWAVHVYAFPVLSRMYYEDRELFNQDEAVIIKKLEENLKPLKPKEAGLKDAILDRFRE